MPFGLHERLFEPLMEENTENSHLFYEKYKPMWNNFTDRGKYLGKAWYPGMTQGAYFMFNISYERIAKVISKLTGKTQASLQKTEGRDSPYFDRSVITDHMEYIWSEIDYGSGVDIVKGIATVNATGYIFIASVPYQEGDLDHYTDHIFEED